MNPQPCFAIPLMLPPVEERTDYAIVGGVGYRLANYSEAEQSLLLSRCSLEWRDNLLNLCLPHIPEDEGWLRDCVRDALSKEDR